jgi:two-component system cell cycle response regulator
VTVSIGVATANVHDMTAEDLIKRADVGLYRAKESGRNRVVAAAETMQSEQQLSTTI